VRISLIVAMDRNGLIGNETGLPWRLPADLRRFRKLTTGHPIIMGRKTFEQIGGPLKERLNIVLTRAAEAPPILKDCAIAHSFDDALRIAREAATQMNTDEIFIIGGAEAYRQALPLVERIYLTLVEGTFEGNAWFPKDESFRGKIVRAESIAADEKNPYSHRFVVVERSISGLSLGEATAAVGTSPLTAEDADRC
jgi:dihydrofolate reductase